MTFQDIGHPTDWDYEIGSPHLAHARLNRWMTGVIRLALSDLLGERGSARVLEIGAGHGSFTDHLLAAGAQVTITEMSRASYSLLHERYRHNPRAEVLFDETGESSDLAGRKFDMILCVAVLHHIPDYMAAVRTWMELLDKGGIFLSFQDPLYYPRLSPTLRRFERGCYYLWRVFRGDLVTGMKSYFRRRRGAMDETNPNDMVEYHVLRDGCDECLIADELRAKFSDVIIYRYWSTQARILQRLGERLHLDSDFGVVARGLTTA